MISSWGQTQFWCYTYVTLSPFDLTMSFTWVIHKAPPTKNKKVSFCSHFPRVELHFSNYKISPLKSALKRKIYICLDSGRFQGFLSKRSFLLENQNMAKTWSILGLQSSKWLIFQFYEGLILQHIPVKVSENKVSFMTFFPETYWFIPRFL